MTVSVNGVVRTGQLSPRSVAVGGKGARATSMWPSVPALMVFNIAPCAEFDAG
ncbi:hypothetical protein [Pararobbsia alpina]|uniref:hypothetical protein n=1 Tax=Pararobbsia alpina TaxID=621374 RepID=UPI0015840687|nr:hypothetical protein [Pararobbsia alpina]